MTFGASETPGPAAVAPAADYDRFVDWDKRLSREAPFFRHEFDAHAVKSVIDVGAGSGMHATMWATWGLEVVAVDPDAAMLAQAEHNIGKALPEIEAAGGSIELMRGSFGELNGMGLAVADAVTCTGNALPHIPGESALEPTLADFASVLRPGGLLILHLLNHDRLIGGHIRAIPPKVRDDAEGRWVSLRVMDYPDEGIRFDFLTLHRPASAADGAGDWEMSARSSVHTALPSATLVRALEATGFRDVMLYGDHEKTPLRPATDESVILTAVRV